MENFLRPNPRGRGSGKLTTRTALMLGGALAIALSGCGAERVRTVTVSKPAPPPPASTAETAAQAKEKFVVQADAACSRFDTKMVRVNRRIEQIFATSHDALNSERVIDRLSDQINKASLLTDDHLSEFEGLSPPPGDGRAFNQYRYNLSKYPALLQNLAGSLAEDDVTNLRRKANEVKRLRTFERGLALGYGFEVCGRRSVEESTTEELLAL